MDHVDSENITDICFNYTEAQEARHNQSLISGYRIYHGWIPLPFGIVEFSITVLFLMAVIRAIQSREVSRKCYLLIANRSIGDLVISITSIGNSIFYIVVDVTSFYYFYSNDIPDGIRAAFYLSGFWLGMISYILLSGLKLYAVTAPFSYVKHATTRKVIWMIISSWIIFPVIVLTLTSAMLLTFEKQFSQWSNCTYSSCLSPIYRIHYVLTISAFVIVIICLAIIVIRVRRVRLVNELSIETANSNCTSTTNTVIQSKILTDNGGCTKTNPIRRPRLRFATWKLGLNVGSFVVFNLIYVLYMAYLFYLMSYVDECTAQRMFYPFLLKTTAWIRLTQTLRIIIEPIISLLTDSAVS